MISEGGGVNAKEEGTVILEGESRGKLFSIFLFYFLYIVFCSAQTAWSTEASAVPASLIPRL